MEARREHQVTFSITGHLILVRQCLSLSLVASKRQSSPVTGPQSSELTGVCGHGRCLHWVHVNTGFELRDSYLQTTFHTELWLQLEELFLLST